jgi:hypothetical protein
MSKPSQITGVYQLGEHERIQFTVTIQGVPYPDAIAEAKATVLALMHEELADVMKQNQYIEAQGDE